MFKVIWQKPASPIAVANALVCRVRLAHLMLGSLRRNSPVCPSHTDQVSCDFCSNRPHLHTACRRCGLKEDRNENTVKLNNKLDKEAKRDLVRHIVNNLQWKHFIAHIQGANFLLNVSVKKLWKSVNI